MMDWNLAIVVWLYLDSSENQHLYSGVELFALLFQAVVLTSKLDWNLYN